MDELMKLAVKICTLDELVDRLNISINQYRQNPSENNIHELIITTSLVQTKIMVNKEGFKKVFDDIEKLDKANEMFNNIKPN